MSSNNFYSTEYWTAVKDVTGGTIGGIGIVLVGHPCKYYYIHTIDAIIAISYTSNHNESR